MDINLIIIKENPYGRSDNSMFFSTLVMQDSKRHMSGGKQKGRDRTRTSELNLQGS